MRTCYTVLTLLLLFVPFLSRAETLNAGFVQGIWYSAPTVFADTPTRIYVALRNNTDNDLTGTIRFDDNGTRIGNSYITALPGRLVEGWVDWTPRFGEHTITATITEMKVHVIGETPSTTAISVAVAEDTITVDYDTDADGIGNATDTDDDNDGVSDIDEETAGTDPLVAEIAKQDTQNSSLEENAEVSSKNMPSEGTGNSASIISASGLEQYVGTGTVNSLLSNITDKITTAKEAIDTYQEKRSNALGIYFGESEAGSTTQNTAPQDTVDFNGTSSMSEAGALATITRSRITNTDESFFHSVVAGGGALISGFYTLFLWTLSMALAYPALIELLLLIAIIYIIYRTARKLGERPGYKKS